MNEQVLLDKLRKSQASLLADSLDEAARQGEESDEPEGARYITISDTKAKEMAQQLRNLYAGAI